MTASQSYFHFRRATLNGKQPVALPTLSLQSACAPSGSPHPHPRSRASCCQVVIDYGDIKSILQGLRQADQVLRKADSGLRVELTSYRVLSMGWERPPVLGLTRLSPCSPSKICRITFNFQNSPFIAKSVWFQDCPEMVKHWYLPFLKGQVMYLPGRSLPMERSVGFLATLHRMHDGPR